MWNPMQTIFVYMQGIEFHAPAYCLWQILQLIVGHYKHLQAL